jgi:hypothetical protein
MEIMETIEIDWKPLAAGTVYNPKNPQVQPPEGA